MDIDIEWFGHCNRNGSDKFWGWCSTGPVDSYSFWGKRGCKGLRIKHHRLGIDNEPSDMVESKMDKGYWQVPKPEWDEVQPGLMDQLTSAIVWHTLGESP